MIRVMISIMILVMTVIVIIMTAIFNFKSAIVFCIFLLWVFRVEG